MKAFLKNYRQSPRKVRLVAELIKSKRVADAITILDNLPKRASGPVETLLNSAIANAKQAGISVENLFVENVTVNKGIVLKRSMPRARGSASRINKRTSHVLLTLVEKTVEKKEKSVKKVEKIEEKKKVVKKVEKKSEKSKEVETKA
jgi:large subunit ribosomal protein L22